MYTSIIKACHGVTTIDYRQLCLLLFDKRLLIFVSLGMILYELHAPLMFLARNEFGLGLITNEKLKEKLQEPIQCLAEAARILMREDPQSPEGITGQIAQQSMEQLKASLDCL